MQKQNIKDLIIPALNIGLRLVAMISKFGLIFFLGKFLIPEDVGTYGLLTAIVGYAIYAFGFEFYSYSNRELIVCQNNEIKNIIKNQFAFYLIMYIFLSPFLFLFFSKNLVPSYYFIYILPIIILEHINLEFHRILIALKKPLFASFLFFVRTGAWCLLCIICMKINPNTRNIQFILILWGVSGVIVAIIAIQKLKKYFANQYSKINWKWIYKGVKISIPFLLASLSLRGIFTLDRFFIENTFGLGILGAYVILISMSASIMAFIDAGIVDFSYPKIISAAKHDSAQFKILLKIFSRNIILASIFFSILCWAISKPLLNWYGNPIYIENFFLLKWLLIAVFLYALSTIPHVALYAMGHDKPIIISAIIGFLVFFVFSKVFVTIFGILTIPLALCSCFLLIFIWKLVAFIIVIKYTKISKSKL